MGNEAHYWYSTRPYDEYAGPDNDGELGEFQRLLRAELKQWLTHSKLTTRQCEIFELAVKGYDQSEIAEMLDVSRQLVNKYVDKTATALRNCGGILGLLTTTVEALGWGSLGYYAGCSNWRWYAKHCRERTYLAAQKSASKRRKSRSKLADSG